MSTAMRKAVVTATGMALWLVLAPAAAAQGAAEWFAAVNNGDTAAVQRMLDSRQVHIETRDEKLNTALMLAAGRCNAAMIQVLRARGANAMAGNELGNTPVGVVRQRCGAGSASDLAMNGGSSAPAASAAPRAAPPRAAPPAASPPPAPADGKTPASAFAFILHNMVDGSWTGDWAPRGQMKGLTFEGGTYCTLRFSMRFDDGQYESRTINLANVVLYPEGSSILFKGPIKNGDGSTESHWWLWGPSDPAVTSVAAALTYLKGLCTPKSVW